MDKKSEPVTKYFKAAVAAQVNKGINFKNDDYCQISIEEILNGKTSADIYNELTIKEKNKDASDVEVIIAAKIVKTVFEEQIRLKSGIEELTGIYFIPASLKADGVLVYNEGKLPWIPREMMEPIVESVLAVGKTEDYDEFMSKNMGRVNKIETWEEYIKFAGELYKNVTGSFLTDGAVKEVEMEKGSYIFLDKTVMAVAPILDLYDQLLLTDKSMGLYERFISMSVEEDVPLVKNGLPEMRRHCGQMGGEYSLSPSQRECINHFTCMQDGEILAVNGPPGTGKTTLLQTIVANLYVERALAKQKPPKIVASSTNNQAVTNIIESFGKIDAMGYSNLEQRWVTGVGSFAVYFPSGKKRDEAQKKGYQYTNCRGDDFISSVESDDNIRCSREKMIAQCSEFFGREFATVAKCEEAIYQRLTQIDHARIELLSVVATVKEYPIGNRSLTNYLADLAEKRRNQEALMESLKKRVRDWEEHFARMPFWYKWFSFFPLVRKKIAIKNRIFIRSEEDFITEYMIRSEIEEAYSHLIKSHRTTLADLSKTYGAVEALKKRYDACCDKLDGLNLFVFEKNQNREVWNLEKLNEILDRKLKYVEYWLAVHYYECRWISGEDGLTEKQKRVTWADALKKRYNRLSMLAPCYVMTFYQLPKNFKTFEGNYLWGEIDLLIVDEAGQVMPEIAAASLALAKKSVVVGDEHQIAPVWSVERALDKSLAIAHGVIDNVEKFNELLGNGLNTSESSVMRIASKACKYVKHGQKGLFLSEHRRCYDEIISYCNDLVYKGKLEPMRGAGKTDEKNKLKLIPQMGYYQVNVDFSIKQGGSRYNQAEAKAIVEWICSNWGSIKAAYPDETVKNLVGIVTPFKAQARYVEAEIRRNAELRNNIDVGTVHTFQGAERRIVIVSTVYGGCEECGFIDANASMLNVAVSRAKDSLLVFGDQRCLKDDTQSASGLLKKHTKNSPLQ